MRYLSIDVLRSGAIFFMVLVHFAENLSATESYGWVPAGVAAPVFTFLSGLSYRLWVQGQEARGRTDEQITKRSVRRGLFLFGLGFAFNVFVWMPEDTYNWDVLTFIGAALVFLAFARRIDDSILIAMCVAMFVVSPFLRAESDYNTYWQLGYFDPDMTLSDVLLGFFVNGYFPLFPWLLYPVMGFVAAPHLACEAQLAPTTFRRWLLAGLILVAVSATLFMVRTSVPLAWQKHLVSGWTMFPPSTAYVTGTLGFALVMFVAARRWIDGSPRFSRERGWGKVASTFSTHSLSIYVLHHVIHLWPLWVYGAAQGHHATHYWRMAMPEMVAVALSLVFVVACYALFRWMDRTGRGGIEALMRWICD